MSFTPVYNPTYDLRNQQIENTYTQLLQYDTASQTTYAGGQGMSINLSASSANYSTSASFAITASSLQTSGSVIYWTDFPELPGFGYSSLVIQNTVNNSYLTVATEHGEWVYDTSGSIEFASWTYGEWFTWLDYLGYMSLGDVDNVISGTSIILNDPAQIINLNCVNFQQNGQPFTASYSQFSHNRYEDIDNGLIVYIPFSEGTGSVLNDYSSTGYDFGGTVLTTPFIPTASLQWQTSSVVGGHSVVFNGAATIPPFASIAVNTSSNTSVSGLNKITVGCWFNKTNLPSFNSEILLSKFNTNTSGEWILEIIIAGNIQWTTINLSGSRNDLEGHLPYGINDGVWHHIAGTYNGTSGLQCIYFDGQLLGQSTSQSGSLLNVPSTGIVIGGSEGGTQYFSGSIDEVKIWNRDLSPNEIQSYYQSIVNTSQPYSDVYGSEIISGTLTVLYPITGSLTGTASYSNQNLSSSYSITSSYSHTASYANISSYSAITCVLDSNSQAIAQNYIVTGSYTYTYPSASYTLSSSDNGLLIQINSGSTVTITIPASLPQGFETTLMQLGTGNFIITGSGGVNVNSLNNHSGSAGQFAAVNVVQYNTSSYALFGGLM